MAKLNDRQRKRIIAEYVDGKSMSELAKSYGVSRQSISKILKDEKSCEKLQCKKKEIDLSMLAYFDSKKNVAQALIDKALKVIDGKLDKGTIRDLAGLIKVLKETFAPPDENDGYDNKLEITVTSEDASIEVDDEG